jgi:hypothetical protein
MSGDRTRCWLWPGLVAAVILAFTAPVSLGGRAYFLHSDTDWTDMLCPMRAVVSRGLAGGGRLPLWTPAMYGGFPLLAEGEAGALFPLAWVGPWDHAPRSLSISIVLALLIAGLATYRLGLAVGLAPRAAALAGCTWPLSGQVLSNLALVHCLSTMAFMPLAFAIAEESLARRQPRWLLWLAPVFALALYAGYVQGVYLTGWALVLQIGSAWVFGRSATASPAEPGSHPVRPSDESARVQSLRPSEAASDRLDVPPPVRPSAAHLRWLVVALVLTAPLAAPQLVATLEFVGQSDRAGDLPASAVTMGSLPPARLVKWLHPWLDGDLSRLGTRKPPDGYLHWTHAGYLAVPAIVLAAIHAAREPAIARALALLAVATAVSMGRHTPLISVLLSLPGYARFRNPSRALPFAELVLALLVGWAVDFLARRGRSQVAPTIAGIAALAHVAGLFIVHWPVLPTLPLAEYPPDSSTVAFLRERSGSGRIFTLFDHEAHIEAYLKAGGWRGDQTPYLRRHALLANGTAALHGLFTVQGCGGLVLPRSDFLARGLSSVPPDLAHPRTRLSPELAGLLRLLAVRWVLSARDLESPHLVERHRTRFDWDGFQARVYELASGAAQGGPAARVRVVGRAEPGRGPGNDLSRILSASHDLAAVAILEGLHGPVGRPGHAGEARIIAEDDRTVVVDVRADRPAFVVLADTHYPGWRARVDGLPAPLLRADVAWRAVPVAAGAHRIELALEPVGLRRGVLAMVAGLIVFALLAPAPKAPARSPEAPAAAPDAPACPLRAARGAAFGRGPRDPP